MPWLSSAPENGTVAEGQTGLLEVAVDVNSLALGASLATLFIQTNSGQSPVVKVPITLVIPAYYQAINAGGDAYTDQSGEAWAADAAYVDGGSGYVDAKLKISHMPREIRGTGIRGPAGIRLFFLTPSLVELGKIERTPKNWTSCRRNSGLFSPFRCSVPPPGGGKQQNPVQEGAAKARFAQ